MIDFNFHVDTRVFNVSAFRILLLRASMKSFTSLSGGNQVDGLPPAFSRWHMHYLLSVLKVCVAGTRFISYALEMARF